MNFRDFLTLADFLATRNDEAAWRTSISRAYYAAFHVACEFMVSLGFRVPKADRAHGYLWLRLENSGHSELVRAGRTLKDLRSRRNIADYDRRCRVVQQNADLATSDARAIIACLDALRRPELSEITEAIKKYERDVLKEATWRA
jgi:uncharacterized protein (UPF0332 family)